MPVLPNPKHERFAQELAKGKTATEAYVLAGYKANDGNAATLKGNQRVLDRVQEIVDRGAVRAEVTVESIMNELEEARLLAISNKQAAAAVSASMGKAKVKGLIVDKQEQGKPGDFNGASDDDLERIIASESGARASAPSPNKAKPH